MRAKFNTQRAFTLVEMLVVIAIIAILAAMLLPAISTSKGKAQRVACISNIKQVGLGIILWSQEHEGRFPWLVEPTNGGSYGLNQAWKHFAILSNELVTPKVLHCHSDKERKTADAFNDAANGFTVLGNSALSYAIGTEASEGNASMHVVIDRNITGVDGIVCRVAGITDPVITKLNPFNGGTGWSSETHPGEGNMALADGSAHLFTRFKLLEHLQNTGDTNYSNCILKP